MECASGKLVAGGLLLMETPGCTDKAMDVQEIVLSSQLYADFKSGGSTKFESAKGWLKYYEDAMLRAQWTVIKAQDYTYQPHSDAVVGVEQLMDDYLLKQLPLTQAKAIRQLYTRLAGLANTDPVALQLHHYALKVSGDDSGTSTFALQVNVLEAPTQLASLFLIFTTTQAIGDQPFAQTFSGHRIVGDIQARFSRRTWDADKYPPRRKSIRDFLNGRQHTLILPIPCEVPDGTDRA